jgi:dienelactone hydrolase
VEQPAAPRVDVEPVRAEVRIPSGGLTLRGWIFRPAGPGPFPAIAYNHGSEQHPTVEQYGELGDWFRTRGYVLLLPFRRGAGGSEGEYWQDAVPPQHSPGHWPATIAQLEKENADVSSAIAWLRAQPYVDSARVAVAGCSFGGIHTLLAAEKSQGLRAAVDFAGASMAWASSTELQQRLAVAVDRAAVPVFLLQAENDYNTSPTRILAQKMEAANKPHRAKIYPPHGVSPREGHGGFCLHGMGEWGADVLAFLDAPEGGAR